MREIHISDGTIICDDANYNPISVILDKSKDGGGF